MIAGAAPFILARRSGNRSGCLILSSIERFSPLSALEAMLVGAEGGIEERREGECSSSNIVYVRKSRFKIQCLESTEAECR